MKINKNKLKQIIKEVRMVHARPSPMKSRANSETIEAIKNQRLVEYEQYVDEDGNVYDDEGNVSRRGRSFGRQYGGQTYTGTRPPWSGRSKYKSTRKTSYVGADSNADQIAAVEAAIAVKPNNFLTSILKQLKKGRGLSAKQKSIVKKIIVKNDAEAAKLFEGRRMKITKRQLRRIIKEERQTLLKEYSDYPSWLDLSDQVDDISEMLDMAADKYVTSAWLFSGENEGNAIADGVAEKLEQLYRDAEALGGLIRGSGAIK